MFDPRMLERTLDLWASSWEPEERAAIERALERILDGGSPHPTRLAALAACHALATPRLLALGTRCVARRQFTDEEVAAVKAGTGALARCLKLAERMHGERAVIELLLDDPQSVLADELLDRVDVRDLHYIAQASGDPRIAAEAARRIGRRGEHQRRRLARALGIAIGDLPRATSDATAPGACPSTA